MVVESYIIGILFLFIFILSFNLGVFVARNERLLKDITKLREDMESLDVEITDEEDVPPELLH